MPAAESVGAVQAASQASESVSAFSWGGYVQAVGLMFLLVFALWGVLWLLRRYGRGVFLPRGGARSAELLHVEAQLPLGQRKGLMVVRFQDKHVLLGLSGENIVALSESYIKTEQDAEDFAALLHAPAANEAEPAASACGAQTGHAAEQAHAEGVCAENNRGCHAGG